MAAVRAAHSKQCLDYKDAHCFLFDIKMYGFVFEQNPKNKQTNKQTKNTVRNVTTKKTGIG